MSSRSAALPQISAMSQHEIWSFAFGVSFSRPIASRSDKGRVMVVLRYGANDLLENSIGRKPSFAQAA